MSSQPEPQPPKRQNMSTSTCRLNLNITTVNTSSSAPWEHTAPRAMRQAGLMTIRTDDMETAGEMVQDLCGFLQALAHT